MDNLNNSLNPSVNEEINRLSSINSEPKNGSANTFTKSKPEVEFTPEFKIESPKLSVQSLKAWFNGKLALKDINLDVKEKRVTALIGPSGCGKTTLLRCINRMHDLTPNATADGKVILDDLNIYDKQSDPVLIRRRMGMVFQKT